LQFTALGQSTTVSNPNLNKERAMPRNDRDRDDRDRDDRGRGGDDRDRGGRGRNDGSDRRGGGRDRDAASDFKYAGRSSEDVARAAKESSSRYDSYVDGDFPWFKSHDGENQIRIIPWLSAGHPDYDKLVEKYGRKIGINIVLHRNVGVDKGTYLCLDKTNGEPCPPCDTWRQDDEEALKPSDRMLVWLIDRKNEKTGPQLWAMPLGTSKDINAASQVRGKGGADGEVLLVDDPNEGYDIFFDREGVKDRTRYVRFETDRDPSPLHENEKKQNQWLAYVMDNCLPDILKTYPLDYLEKVLSGQTSRREEDDSNNNNRGSRRPSRRGGSDRDDRDDRANRGDDRDRDDDRGRSHRSSREPDGDTEGEFTRPARRGGRGGDAEPDERASDDRGEDRGGRSERVSGRSGRRSEADGGRDLGRSSRRGDPDPEPDDRGEPASRGGRTERYRGRGDDAPADDGDDGGVDAAKERLGRVGRRGGR
jgi:hypothetical protein